MPVWLMPGARAFDGGCDPNRLNAGPPETPETRVSSRSLPASPAGCYRPAGSSVRKERMSAEDVMEVQALQHENRNPRTIDEGRSLVRHVESLFMPWNIDALVD